MKIAVVGGNGYLGKHVTKFLYGDSFSRVNSFDITNKEHAEKIKGYDVIINMSALIDKSGKNTEQVFEVNARGTENLVRLLNPNQVFILASTKEVHFPEEAYGFSKIAAEVYAEAYSKARGFKLGIFRLSTTYAPSEDKGNFVNYFARAIKNEEELELMVNGTQKRDFLYVDDLSRAFEVFIKSKIKKGVYEIGGGEKNQTTILELVNLLGQKIGKVPRIKFVNGAPRGELNYVTDLSKIQKELHWYPLLGVKDGLNKII